MSAQGHFGPIARDPEGEVVLVGDVTAPTPDGDAPGELRLDLAMLALTDPAEIWYEWTDRPLGDFSPCFTMERAGVVRRYIAQFRDTDAVVHLTLLATVAPEGWRLREVHRSEAALYAARRGQLAYRRP